MEKKKGQALVEFVIILPIFIFMILAIIDVGKMIYTKNRLETEMNNVIEEYHNQKTFEEIKKTWKENHTTIILEIQQEKDDITITLKEEIAIITPGLNLIFKSPYQVTTERVIHHES